MNYGYRQGKQIATHRTSEEPGYARRDQVQTNERNKGRRGLDQGQEKEASRERRARSRGERADVPGVTRQAARSPRALKCPPTHAQTPRPAHQPPITPRAPAVTREGCRLSTPWGSEPGQTRSAWCDRRVGPPATTCHLRWAATQMPADQRGGAAGQREGETGGPKAGQQMGAGGGGGRNPKQLPT